MTLSNYYFIFYLKIDLEFIVVNIVTTKLLNMTDTTLNSKFITYYTGYSMDARRNPIEYKLSELNKCSKWKKYINKIHRLILGNHFPGMCLVRKTNNCYSYLSNHSCDDFTVEFECKFEGDKKRQHCSAVIYNGNTCIFMKSRKTPKELYNKLLDFLVYETNGYTTVPFVFTDKYLYLYERGLVKSFVVKQK